MSTYKLKLGDISGTNKNSKIVIIRGEFNNEPGKKLEIECLTVLKDNGFNNIKTFLVPGAFEIPGFAKRIIEKGQANLIICLGVVIKGDTPHFDYVCSESARGIMNLSIAYDTPIINGILTCNTQEQVIERINGNYAISALNLLSEINKI